jgi:hypothetical protein
MVWLGFIPERTKVAPAPITRPTTKVAIMMVPAYDLRDPPIDRLATMLDKSHRHHWGDASGYYYALLYTSYFTSTSLQAPTEASPDFFLSRQSGQFSNDREWFWLPPFVGDRDNFTGELSALFATPFPGLQFVSIHNETEPSTAVVGDSVAVNSTFDFLARTSISGTGNFTAIISAQDSHICSSQNDGWLISQETWQFSSGTIRCTTLWLLIT